MNIHPPPPINALATALVLVQGTEPRSVKVDQNIESMLEKTIPQFVRNLQEKT